METTIRKCAIATTADDQEQVEITVGKIETELNWWPWKERFQFRLENIYGAMGVPLV